MSIQANTTPNTTHSSKWQLGFSNIPTIANIAQLAVVEQFVQNVVLPDYSVQDLTSNIKQAVLHHPISRNNDALAPITITLKMSEGAENYFYLLRWQLALRYPKNIPTGTDVRDYVCKRITLSILDNQNREVTRLFFTNAYPQNISSVSFDSGTDSEVAFTVSFVYEEMGVEPISIFTS